MQELRYIPSCPSCESHIDPIMENNEFKGWDYDGHQCKLPGGETSKWDFTKCDGWPSFHMNLGRKDGSASTKWSWISRDGGPDGYIRGYSDPRGFGSLEECIQDYLNKNLKD